MSAQEITIEDNLIEANLGHGIYTHYDSHPVIRGNEIADNGRNGILAEPKGPHGVRLPGSRSSVLCSSA